MSIAVRKSIYGLSLGLCASGIATCLAFQVNLNLAASGLLQLLAVLFVALRTGFWEATAVSIFANFSLLYFVVPPILSLKSEDSENWVALCTFEIMALLVSRLSAHARDRAATARQRHGELEKLYELSRQMLLLDKESEAGPQIVLLIQRIFPSDEVLLIEARSELLHRAGQPSDGMLESATQTAVLEERDLEAPDAGVWVRVLRLDGSVSGALGLRGREFSVVSTKALASLAAICMDRARSFEDERRATAEKRAEELRTAVLDGIAHDFKTPLTVIRTASNGLLAMDGLFGAQREMIDRVDKEATRLTEITTKLLRTSRLDKRTKEPVEESASAGARVFTR